MQYKKAKWIALLSAALMLHPTLQAKETEVRLPWEQLPSSLTGQDVTVVQTDHKRIKGRLIRIEADRLVVESRGGERSVTRTNTERIETMKRGQHVRGRAIWTSVGAGVGIVVIGVAATYKHNENGSNSDAIVGAAAGVAGVTTLAGYLIGRESDTDRNVIVLVAK